MSGSLKDSKGRFLKEEVEASEILEKLAERERDWQDKVGKENETETSLEKIKHFECCLGHELASAKTSEQTAV